MNIEEIGIHYRDITQYSCETCTRKCGDRSEICFKYSLFYADTAVFSVGYNDEGAYYFGVVMP